MNTNPSSPGDTATRRTRAAAAVAGLATVALLTTTACSGNGVHNDRTFQSALVRGARGRRW
jgi:hypothetical protein